MIYWTKYKSVYNEETDTNIMTNELEIIKESDEDFVTDGPFIHKLENGKLLMLWSSDGKDGYAMGMAISSNGIKGPWSHFEKP
jgi:hypothetical protein